MLVDVQQDATRCRGRRADRSRRRCAGLKVDVSNTAQGVNLWAVIRGVRQFTLMGLMRPKKTQLS